MNVEARNKHTILIIEDNPEIRESLCDALEDEGYNVVTAWNGEEGLEQLRDIAEPSLILLDMMMPIMGGGEFLAVLRSTDVLARIPVVVISAWPKEVGQVKDLTQGFIKKPVELDALLEAVAKFCSPMASR